MVAAGKVGGLFGTKGRSEGGDAGGGVSLTLYDNFPRDFNIEEEPVYVKIDSLTVPLFFDSLHRRGVRGATAVFADIDTEARAEELVGLEFFLRDDNIGGNDRSDLGYAEQDFTDWEAYFGNGLQGRIVDFIDSEMNPLFEVEIAGAREFIPAQEDLIERVDEKNHKIFFSLPEGLLGLNA